MAIKCGWIKAIFKICELWITNEIKHTFRDIASIKYDKA